MKSESVWSSLTAHGKGRKMISGRKMIGFLQSHKTAIILMFLSILFSISISSAATPTIIWNDPADITYGTALSTHQLNASASVPGTFIYYPPAGAVLGAGAKILHVDFIPEDTANYKAHFMYLLMIGKQAGLQMAVLEFLGTSQLGYYSSN